MPDKKPPLFAPETRDVRPLGAPVERDLAVDEGAFVPTEATPPATSREAFAATPRGEPAAPPGLSPASAEAAPKPVEGPVQTFEQWARARKIDPATLAGTKAKNGWAIGQVMTEQEFIDGVKAFTEIEVR